MASRIMARRFATLTLVAGSAIALGGCAATAALGQKVTRTIDVERVIVCASKDANDDHPVPVDIVLPMDEELAKRLAELTSRDWFARRERLMQRFADALVVKSRVVVPRDLVTVDISLLERYRSHAGFVFLNLLTRGDHRIQFDNLRQLRVQITREAFEYDTTPESDAQMCI